MCLWAVLGMNVRVGMSASGKDGIDFWGKQEEEKGGMKIWLHKEKQQKWAFITDLKVSGDVYIEEEWEKKDKKPHDF